MKNSNTSEHIFFVLPHATKLQKQKTKFSNGHGPVLALWSIGHRQQTLQMLAVQTQPFLLWATCTHLCQLSRSFGCALQGCSQSLLLLVPLASLPALRVHRAQSTGWALFTEKPEKHHLDDGALLCLFIAWASAPVVSGLSNAASKVQSSGAVETGKQRELPFNFANPLWQPLTWHFTFGHFRFVHFEGQQCFVGAAPAWKCLLCPLVSLPSSGLAASKSILMSRQECFQLSLWTCIEQAAAMHCTDCPWSMSVTTVFTHHGTLQESAQPLSQQSAQQCTFLNRSCAMPLFVSWGTQPHLAWSVKQSRCFHLEGAKHFWWSHMKMPCLHNGPQLQISLWIIRQAHDMLRQPATWKWIPSASTASATATEQFDSNAPFLCKLSCCQRMWSLWRLDNFQLHQFDWMSFVLHCWHTSCPLKSSSKIFIRLCFLGCHMQSSNKLIRWQSNRFVMEQALFIKHCLLLFFKLFHLWIPLGESAVNSTCALAVKCSHSSLVGFLIRKWVIALVNESGVTNGSSSVHQHCCCIVSFSRFRNHVFWFVIHSQAIVSQLHWTHQVIFHSWNKCCLMQHQHVCDTSHWMIAGHNCTDCVTCRHVTTCSFITTNNLNLLVPIVCDQCSVQSQQHMCQHAHPTHCCMMLFHSNCFQLVQFTSSLWWPIDAFSLWVPCFQWTENWHLKLTSFIWELCLISFLSASSEQVHHCHHLRIHQRRILPCPHLLMLSASLQSADLRASIKCLSKDTTFSMSSTMEQHGTWSHQISLCSVLTSSQSMLSSTLTSQRTARCTSAELVSQVALGILVWQSIWLHKMTTTHCNEWKQEPGNRNTCNPSCNQLQFVCWLEVWFVFVVEWLVWWEVAFGIFVPGCSPVPFCFLEAVSENDVEWLF